MFAPKSFKHIARNKMTLPENTFPLPRFMYFFDGLAALKQDRKNPLSDEKWWSSLIYRNPVHCLFVKYFQVEAMKHLPAFLHFFTITSSQHHQRAEYILCKCLTSTTTLEGQMKRMLKTNSKEPQTSVWSLEFSTFLLTQHTSNRQGPAGFKNWVRVYLTLQPRNFSAEREA